MIHISPSCIPRFHETGVRVWECFAVFADDTSLFVNDERPLGIQLGAFDSDGIDRRGPDIATFYFLAEWTRALAANQFGEFVKGFRQRRGEGRC